VRKCKVDNFDSYAKAKNSDAEEMSCGAESEVYLGVKDQVRNVAKK
jgi:hypothetical protein